MDRIFSPSRVFLTPVVASCTAQLCATAAITIPSQVVQLHHANKQQGRESQVKSGAGVEVGLWGQSWDLATAVLLVSGDLLVLRRAWGKAVLSKR